MEENDVITVLSEEESLARMATEQLGRLVVRRADDFDIFPINFVVDDGKIYVRTSEGDKLFTMALNNDVAFEADHVSDSLAWSVVVKGTARLLDKNAEIQHADTLPLRPWLPTLKYRYVEIVPTTISGRQFHLGEEPERY